MTLLARTVLALLLLTGLMGPAPVPASAGAAPPEPSPDPLEEFVPGETVPADSAVAFPVDI